MAAKKPAKSFNIGPIKVTIWENQKDDGNVWFNVNVCRLYKKDGKWHDADSFRRDDLIIVAKAVDMAFNWIWRRQNTPAEPQKR